MAEMTLVTKSTWPAECKPLTVCVLQRKFAAPWSAVPVTRQGVYAVPAREGSVDKVSQRPGRPCALLPEGGSDTNSNTTLLLIFEH